MDAQCYFYGLLSRLTVLRLELPPFSFGNREPLESCRDWAALGLRQGFVTRFQAGLIYRLIVNALQNGGRPFPDPMNAGPYMPTSVWYERAKENALLIRASNNERSKQVSSPAPRRELRLLCLLVENGGFSRTYPPQTLRSVPPRVDHFSKWGGSNLPGLFMRETHAIAPAPEVLARLQRHGQTRSLCAAESPRRHCATV